MGDPAPGEESLGRSRGARAISTTVRDNSAAFGFSITITITFGLVQSVGGQPAAGEIFAFGAAAALGVLLFAAVATRGFRMRAGRAPAEVRMLGTSLDFISVLAAAAAGYAVALLLFGFIAWPAAAIAAVVVFLGLQSAEILFAEHVQERRGDPDA